jgi:hypothetical protein
VVLLGDLIGSDPRFNSERAYVRLVLWREHQLDKLDQESSILSSHTRASWRFHADA